MDPLTQHVATSGDLLQRCRRVIVDLQTDVGGLLWEIDQRLGSSFHEEVVAALPSIQATASPQAAQPVAHTPTSPASPDTVGRQLLASAAERVELLQRAYNTITGLQVDVDACLYELERGSSTRLGPPLPFPPLATPSGDGHTATTLYAYAQVDATSGSSLEHQRQQQLLEKQQPQGGSTAAADLHGTPAALLSREGGRPGRGMLLAQQQQQQQVEVGKSGGSDTPPTQHLPPAPAGMSPTTAAFVDAAFTSRDTEAAAFAGQPRAVLNTSLKDAACEAGRMATVRRRLVQQASGLPPSAGENLASLFEQAAAHPTAAQMAAGRTSLADAAGGTLNSDGVDAASAEGPAILPRVPQVATASLTHPAAEALQAAQAASASSPYSGRLHGQPQLPDAEAEQQPLGKGAAEGQVPGGLPGASPLANAHTAALERLLSSLRASQAASGTSPLPTAAALPPSAVRGPSLQQEVIALSAFAGRDAAEAPNAAGPALALPPPQQQQQQQQLAAAPSFLRRVLTAARGSSSTSDAPPAALPAAKPPEASFYSRSSSTRTTLHVAPAVAATNDSGSDGPNYSAAMAAAAEVAREINALRHLAEQPLAAEQDDDEGVQGGSSGLPAAECTYPAQGLTAQPASAAEAADTGPVLAAVPLLPAVISRPASPAEAVAAAGHASPTTVADGSGRSDDMALYGSGAATEHSPTAAVAAATAASPASGGSKPFGGSASAWHQTGSPIQQGSPFRDSPAHGGPNQDSSASSRQDPGSIDAMLAELEASALGHGAAAHQSSAPWAQPAAQSLAMAAGLLAGVAALEVQEAAAPVRQEGEGHAGSSTGGVGSASPPAPEQEPALGIVDGTTLQQPASRLLRRFVTHVQHDSVGSVSDEARLPALVHREEAPAAAAGAAAGVSLQAEAAAQAADLAQHILGQIHGALQQEAAASLAAAAAAEQEAAAADAAVRALQVQGMEAGAVAAEASRLHAAVEPAQLGAAQAALRLAELEQDVQAAAGAAAEALRSHSGPSKAAAAKAAAAAMALQAAVKWAVAAAAASRGGPATDGTCCGQGNAVPNAISELLPAAEALLARLEPASLELQSSLDCCYEQGHAKELPEQPMMQQVWRVEQASSGEGEQQEQAAPEAVAAAAFSGSVAAEQGQCTGQAAHQPPASIRDAVCHWQLTAEATAEPSSPALPRPSSLLHLQHEQVESQPSQHPQPGSLIAERAPCTVGLSTSPPANSLSSSHASPQLQGPPSADQAQRAAAAMLGKQERALTRAEQAELEAERLRAAGWTDASAAASTSAAKWRRRADNAAKVAMLAFRHAGLAAEGAQPAAGDAAVSVDEGQPASAAVPASPAQEEWTLPIALVAAAAEPEQQLCSTRSSHAGGAGLEASDLHQASLQPAISSSDCGYGGAAAVTCGSIDSSSWRSEGAADVQQQPSGDDRSTSESGLRGSSSSSSSSARHLPASRGSSGSCEERLASGHLSCRGGHTSSSSSSTTGGSYVSTTDSHASDQSSADSGDLASSGRLAGAPGSAHSAWPAAAKAKAERLSAHGAQAMLPAAALPPAAATGERWAGSHRQAPRPLPAFCSTAAASAPSQQLSPAGLVDGAPQAAAKPSSSADGGSSFPDGSTLAASQLEQRAPADREQPARHSLSSTSIQASRAAPAEDPTQLDGGSMRLQQQLDRLERQLARSRQQRAAASALAAAARQRAASDTGGSSYNWLSGFVTAAGASQVVPGMQ